jgi:lysophospholipase L1-like esterase
MATGGIAGLIPPQLDSAIAFSKNIKFLLMDGGGNDILICDQVKFPGCSTTCSKAGSAQNTTCQNIVKTATDAGLKLLTKASGAGIKDIIFFFYPHTTSNGGGYGEILDYSIPLVKANCEGLNASTGGKTNCYFVDTIAAFKAAGGDKNPANFAIDGIHPSAAGQKIISTEIDKVMKDKCVGQPASSGCCAP